MIHCHNMYHVETGMITHRAEVRVTGVEGVDLPSDLMQTALLALLGTSVGGFKILLVRAGSRGRV
jgi:hypothetical protein